MYGKMILIHAGVISDSLWHVMLEKRLVLIRRFLPCCVFYHQIPYFRYLLVSPIFYLGA